MILEGSPSPPEVQTVVYGTTLGKEVHNGRVIFGGVGIAWISRSLCPTSPRYVANSRASGT